MRHSFLRGLRFAVAATLLFAPEVVAFAQAPQGPWLETRRGHHTVFYQTDFAQDTLFAHTWADAAERLMKDKYGVTPEHYRLEIYLYPAPTAKIDVNNARNRCCTKGPDSISTAVIEILTPSAPAMRNATAISSLGMPKNDESYHAKILMSEYIPIGHWEAQRARADSGWMYYDAPNWFVQGLQEYDAIFHTTDTNRDLTSKRLMAWAAAHPTVFSCCNPEIAISDDYNGGATFVTFLAAQFGEAVHARMLRSSAKTFAEALTEVTKPYSRQQLFDLFQKWRQ